MEQLKNKTILVVDDYKMNLIAAQKMLKDDYKVAVVNSGRMALQYLSTHTPDIILLDIQMPDMNGFEVMEKLKSDVDLCKIPVIFLTADYSIETEEKCFILGAVDFICKPFAPAIFKQRIKRTLELEGYRKNLEKMVSMQLKKITQLQDDIIITMANLIESRDGTTGEHVKRTSMLTEYFVEKLREKGVYKDVIDEKFINYVSKATPLHDIGKIVVPDMILQKPGKLTPEEYETIKLHAKKGGEIIKNNMSGIVDDEFLHIAFDMATYHHEKWAGNGYPSGISGENIPLSARILAIADVFDAIASKRQYKNQMTVGETIGIMEKDRGIAFEPVLFDVFHELVEDLPELFGYLK